MNTLKFENSVILTFSSYERFWHLHTLIFSTFWTFWHFQRVTSSRDIESPGIFSFWHVYVLTFTDSDILQILAFTESDIYRFWHLQILTFTNSDIYRFWHLQILTFTDSDIYKFWHLQILTFTDSDIYKFWHLQILTFTNSDISGSGQKKWILTSSALSLVSVCLSVCPSDSGRTTATIGCMWGGRAASSLTSHPGKNYTSLALYK